jgi:hypothetical protein
MCLGIPGRVVEVHDDAGLRMGTVDFGGVRREVCLQCTPDAGVGTYVIVHVALSPPASASSTSVIATGGPSWDRPCATGRSCCRS